MAPSHHPPYENWTLGSPRNEAIYIDSLQVDNASALITAAKNLMTAVVLTVKTCYVASTAVSCTYILVMFLAIEAI